MYLSGNVDTYAFKKQGVGVLSIAYWEKGLAFLKPAPCLMVDTPCCIQSFQAPMAMSVWSGCSFLQIGWMFTMYRDDADWKRVLRISVDVLYYPGYATDGSNAIHWRRLLLWGFACEGRVYSSLCDVLGGRGDPTRCGLGRKLGGWESNVCGIISQWWGEQVMFWVDTTLKEQHMAGMFHVIILFHGGRRCSCWLFCKIT